MSMLAVVLIVALPPGGTSNAEPGKPVSTPSERTFLLPPDADQRILYGGDISSDPLPDRVPPTTISRAAALQIATKLEAPKGAPLVTLRMVSSPDRQHGMSGKPRPYWVVTWPNSEPVIRGGYIADPKKRAEALAEREKFRARAACVDYLFVDAESGRVHGVWQQCTQR